MKVEVYYIESLTNSFHPNDPETYDEILLHIPEFDLWLHNEGYNCIEIREIQWTDEFWKVVKRCGDHVTYLGEL